ncbi:hypothetical protein B566_EDAN013295 [Ephemera danica]|nr:hypothetical protein B566_EDAN013295 [Ephemera danica]
MLAKSGKLVGKKTISQLKPQNSDHGKKVRVMFASSGDINHPEMLDILGSKGVPRYHLHTTAVRTLEIVVIVRNIHGNKTARNFGSRASNVSEEVTLAPPTARLPAGAALLEVSASGTAVARTESPKLLGYIFDTHSNLKHHHHDHRWGPHFEEASNVTNMTVQVSWVRRRNGDDLELLTVGLHTYSGDSRYTVEFQYPNNWRLQVKYANKRDEGLYDVQLLLALKHPLEAYSVPAHIKTEQPRDMAPKLAPSDAGGAALENPSLFRLFALNS